MPVPMRKSNVKYSVIRMPRDQKEFLCFVSGNIATLSSAEVDTFQSYGAVGNQIEVQLVGASTIREGRIKEFNGPRSMIIEILDY